jgi:hypothetical protein
VENGKRIATITGMARPRKNKSDRKDFDLRVPLTASQKALVAKAARLEGQDMAAWARPILIEAASKRVEVQHSLTDVTGQ